MPVWLDFVGAWLLRGHCLCVRCTAIAALHTFLCIVQFVAVMQESLKSAVDSFVAWRNVHLQQHDLELYDPKQAIRPVSDVSHDQPSDGAELVAKSIEDGLINVNEQRQSRKIV
jgi:hypothetical protein